MLSASSREIWHNCSLNKLAGYTCEVYSSFHFVWLRRWMNSSFEIGFYLIYVNRLSELSKLNFRFWIKVLCKLESTFHRHFLLYSVYFKKLLMCLCLTKARDCLLLSGYWSNVVVLKFGRIHEAQALHVIQFNFTFFSELYFTFNLK